MKKVFISIIIVFSLGFSKVNAAYFSDYLPGGKNYIDPNNFTLDGEEVYNIDPIKVKPNTTYTISIPGTNMFASPLITVFSLETIYISGSASQAVMCSVDSFITVCTFTTTSDDDYLNVIVEDVEMTRFIEFYGYENFQLEEGSVNTEFEAYVVPLDDSNSPEFSGSAAYIMSYNETTPLADIIREHVIVIDDVDGDISDNIVVYSDEYSSNIGIVGEYLVELRAYDSSGNWSAFNLVVIIKDEDSPVINGPENIVVSVSDQIDISEIITANFLAVDGYDDTLNITTTLDDYSLGMAELGIYNVTLYVIDESQNTCSKNITITVVDSTAPELEGSNLLNVYLDDIKTIEEVIQTLNISDNYDDSSYITVVVSNDNYTLNEDTLGEYQVDLILQDSANNQAEYSIYISVVDNILPTIMGPSNYSFSYVEEYTMNDFLNLLTVSDNYDSISIDDLVILEDTYSARTELVGDFYIEFEATDTSGNTTCFTLNLTIVDDQAPIIYVDNYLITLSSTVTFKEEDAVKMLINNHEIPDDEYEITTIVNEYLNNEKVPGNYRYTILLTNDDGVTYHKEFIIKVPELDSNDYNPKTLIRNILVYTIAVSVITFVIIKNKKH